MSTDTTLDFGRRDIVPFCTIGIAQSIVERYISIFILSREVTPSVTSTSRVVNRYAKRQRNGYLVPALTRPPEEEEQRLTLAIASPSLKNSSPLAKTFLRTFFSVASVPPSPT